MSDTGSPEPLVLVSCPKGQVEKYVNVEACPLRLFGFLAVRDFKAFDIELKFKKCIMHTKFLVDESPRLSPVLVVSESADMNYKI